MPRLFTCIWIPREIKEEVIKIQEKLNKTSIKGKFVESENLHLTLVFIGNLDESNLESLKEKLNNILENVKKFHVKLQGLKIIPNENYIRVIGIEIKNEDNKLSGLIKKMGENINGKYHENSKITLCRVKGVLDKQKLRNFIEENRNKNFGSFEVKNVALVESKLTKKGPIYKTIYEISLK